MYSLTKRLPSLLTRDFAASFDAPTVMSMVIAVARYIPMENLTHSTTLESGHGSTQNKKMPMSALEHSNPMTNKKKGQQFTPVGFLASNIGQENEIEEIIRAKLVTSLLPLGLLP